MKILIQHGHVIDPAHQIDRVADVAIAAGKIVAVGSVPSDFSPNRVIEAQGLVVAPGLVDLSARLREPGYEYKATLETEMRAAMHGGVTSLSCPPDTDPVLDEPGLVEMLKFRAQSLNQAHVYPQGALTLGLKGDTLTEMNELTEAGCIGFGQADAPMVNTQVLLRAMQYAHTFGYTVWLRPQDAWLGQGGVAHSGPVAARLGLSGVSVSAETVALHTIFELMRVTGCRVHLCRLSSAAGIELVRQAKREGLPVSADVSITHLHLIDIDIGYFNAMMHLSPPLRTSRDRDAISQGLLDGTIDAITSDHCPVDDDEKLLPFAEASPGATGLELLLPQTLHWAARANCKPAQALAKVTQAAARILGIEAGHLGVGAVADICLYDPDAHWRVTPVSLTSQGKNTPFLGHEVRGEVVFTLVAGQVAYEKPTCAT
jgi:dihydroorotase